MITSNTNRKAFMIVLMLWKDQTIAEIFAPFAINLWLSKCQFFFSFQLLSIYSRQTLCIFCNVQLNDVINSVLATLHKEKFKWLLFLIFPSSTKTSSALCMCERKKPGADPGIWGSSILCENVFCAGKLLHPTYLTVYYYSTTTVL